MKELAKGCLAFGAYGMCAAVGACVVFGIFELVKYKMMQGGKKS
jgi:hypothetical protein